MKYMAMRYAMIRDGVENGAIALRNIPTELNCANQLTKPVAGKLFRQLRALLLGLDINAICTRKHKPSATPYILPYQCRQTAFSASRCACRHAS